MIFLSQFSSYFVLYIIGYINLIADGKFYNCHMIKYTETFRIHVSVDGVKQTTYPSNEFKAHYKQYSTIL